MSPVYSVTYVSGCSTFTVTYDNQGTVYHTWYDGPNKIAEFGGGDDTIEDTNTANPIFPIMSDATITVSGLAQLPSGSGPDNHFPVDNFSYVYETRTNQIQIAFQNNSDQYELFLNSNGAGHISIQQWFNYTRPREQYVFGADFDSGAAQITTTTVPAIPEPTSLLLLGSGLGAVGLAALSRRKA